MMSEAALKAGNKRRVKERLNRSTIATAGIESRSGNLSNLAIGCGSRQNRLPSVKKKRILEGGDLMLTLSDAIRVIGYGK